MAAFVAAPIFAWRKGRLGAALRDVARQLGRTFRRKGLPEPELAHEPTWMPLAPAILAGVVLMAVVSWR